MTVTHYERQLARLLWRQRAILFAVRLVLLLIGIGLRAGRCLATLLHVGEMVLC